MKMCQWCGDWFKRSVMLLVDAYGIHLLKAGSELYAFAHRHLCWWEELVPPRPPLSTSSCLASTLRRPPQRPSPSPTSPLHRSSKCLLRSVGDSASLLLFLVHPCLCSHCIPPFIPSFNVAQWHILWQCYLKPASLSISGISPCKHALQLICT